MFRTLFTAALLSFFFFGCAVKEPLQEKAKPGSSEVIVKDKISEKNPCETLIDEAVLQSRKTMKTVKESCQGLLIEANPMWDINYDGTIRIRVYDSESKQVRDEFRKLPNSQ